MSDRSNIVLVGFMGTGKTAVGRKLAERLGRPFVDTDAWIEEEGPIPELFASRGEAAFRELEARAVARAAALREAVIATGGGALGRDENLARLQGSGMLVCLTARPEVILERTAPWTGRPMLAGAPDPVARVTELLAARTPRYALADLTIDTSDLSLSLVVEQICEMLHLEPPMNVKKRPLSADFAD